MSGVKDKLKSAFFSLPTQSKMKLYRRLYQGKAPLCLGLWEWCQWKCAPQRDTLHDVFVDYSEIPGVYTSAQLIDHLSSFDEVSFDIFDTLLFRRVEKPADVFSLVEQRLSVPGFAQYRVECEWHARQEKHRKCGSWEVSFAEIYAQMTAYSTEQRTQRQQVELTVEQEQLVANPVMKELAEGLTARGVRLIAISDMYLDGETLTRLLKGCGYPPFERVYSSSEEGVSKSEGALFRRVCEREHWQGKQIAHIGDNFHSDVMMGTAHVRKAIHYLR